VSGPWPEGGGGGGPWVAFLAPEVGASSPGGERAGGREGGRWKTFQEKDRRVCVCVTHSVAAISNAS